jgi:Asp-tRNA(Asn)/Glu-tRNA(Gln) amidotransferase A subunit family amidase
VDPTHLHWLSAADAARVVRDGAVSSEELVGACLARVREADPDIQAWAHLDPEHALAQARILDNMRRAGEVLGPLHGVPVGVKDIIDTTDMPTECGTALHAGRLPAHDASVVSMLRAAGAVVLGKTVTTEFALYRPGKTRNPRDPSRTPGGSSSGSAAAVASGMVPMALGTQTNGSVIRPAAFCGVYGFKPTHGAISRHGILRLSRTLDHVGVFARTLEDVALGCEPLVGGDDRDPDTRPRARIPFRELAAAEPPLPPLFAWVEPPGWEKAEPEMREAFAELVEALGERIVKIPLGDSASRALDIHRTILEAELAVSLASDYARGKEAMSPGLREQIERGLRVSAYDHQVAIARIAVINEGFEEIFERCDAIVTPAALGVAPKGLESTGDPSCCTLWTLAGMPALSMPLMQGEGGLPIGVQLVGPRDSDARLLRTARWLSERLANE